MTPHESSTKYDSAFQAIPGLLWLPWVGQNYSQRPEGHRLLIVGESPYTRQTDAETLEKVRKQHDGHSGFTRDIVSEALIRREWTTPTLSNIPKLLFKSTPTSAPRLWADTGYHNIVQRLMNYPERPGWGDFQTGWKVLVEIIRIMQPSHCLFLGVQAASGFNQMMTNLELPFSKVTTTKRVSRTWGRKAKLNVAGNTTELMFVQHPGRHFSWIKWHDHLQAEHADFMDWLKTEEYAASFKV